MQSLVIQNAIILDTETTGLDSKAQICEISLIDAISGEVLLNQLIKPSHPIPAEATRIHGITDKDVEHERNFLFHWDHYIQPVLAGRPLIIYNADYDVRLILQSLAPYCNDMTLLNTRIALNSFAQCAMVWYAEFYGQWDDWHENLKWQSLTNACAQQGIDVSDLKAHRATADCEMTRRLVSVVNTKLENAA